MSVENRQFRPVGEVVRETADLSPIIRRQSVKFLSLRRGPNLVCNLFIADLMNRSFLAAQILDVLVTFACLIIHVAAMPGGQCCSWKCARTRAHLILSVKDPFKSFCPV